MTGPLFKRIFKTQLQILKIWNELFDIRITLSCVGDSQYLSWIEKEIESFKENCNLIYHGDDISCFEYPTLHLVEKYCKENDGNVFYGFSKFIANVVCSFESIHYRHEEIKQQNMKMVLF